MTSPWTEEFTDRLRILWGEGLSFAQIAARMEVTRNSVIGRAHRIELNGRTYANTKRTPEQIEMTRRRALERNNIRRRKMRAEAPRISEAKLTELRCVEIEPRHLSLLDLCPHDCRYVYGDSPFTFCGQPKLEGSSYCGPHLALSRRGRNE